MAWPPAQVHIAARQWPLSHLPAVTSVAQRGSESFSATRTVVIQNYIVRSYILRRFTTGSPINENPLKPVA